MVADCCRVNADLLGLDRSNGSLLVGRGKLASSLPEQRVGVFILTREGLHLLDWLKRTINKLCETANFYLLMPLNHLRVQVTECLPELVFHDAIELTVGPQSF